MQIAVLRLKKVCPLGTIGAKRRHKMQVSLKEMQDKLNSKFLEEALRKNSPTALPRELFIRQARYK